MAESPAWTVLVFGESEAGEVRDFVGEAPLPVRFVDIQAVYVERRSLLQQADPNRFGYIGRKPSLAHVCDQVLGKPIDKTLQEGPWDTPFRHAEPGKFDARIEYALLDSYVLILLWDALREPEDGSGDHDAGHDAGADSGK